MSNSVVMENKCWIISELEFKENQGELTNGESNHEGMNLFI